MVQQMALQAAKDIGLQRGAEYGFSQQRSVRATEISLLTPEEICGLPVNNMPCERQFSKWDRMINRSANGSSQFQGKGKLLSILTREKHDGAYSFESI